MKLTRAISAIGLVACLAAGAYAQGFKYTPFTTNAAPTVTNVVKAIAAQNTNFTGTFTGNGAGLTNLQNPILVGGTNAVYVDNAKLNGYALGAGNVASSGIHNVAVGSGALSSSNGSSYSLAIGNRSLSYLTNGDDNITLGNNALASMAYGDTMNVIGTSAGFYTTNGSSSVFVGHHAAEFIGNSIQDIAIGVSALQGDVDGADGGTISPTKSTLANIAIGPKALQYIGAGYDNIALGYGAGRGGTNADERTINDHDMTFIGIYASRDRTVSNSTVLHDSVAIGSHATVAGNNMITLGGVGDYAAKVGIGTNAPAYPLDVVGNGRFSGNVYVNSLVGNYLYWGSEYWQMYDTGPGSDTVMKFSSGGYQERFRFGAGGDFAAVKSVTVGSMLSLTPLASTTTNASCASVWNSNNAALFVRGTNGVDTLLLAIP